MKSALTISAFALLSVAFAGCSVADATDSPNLESDDQDVTSLRSLHCEDERPASWNDSGSYTLDAKISSSTRLRNVRFTAVDPDFDPSTTVGTATTQDANPSYRPTKYKSSNQFKLDLETKSGERFFPGDQCSLQVILPDNLGSLKAGTSLTGRVLASCDQGGGSMAFNCKIR